MSFCGSISRSWQNNNKITNEIVKSRKKIENTWKSCRLGADMKRMESGTRTMNPIEIKDVIYGIYVVQTGK